MLALRDSTIPQQNIFVVRTIGLIVPTGISKLFVVTIWPIVWLIGLHEEDAWRAGRVVNQQEASTTNESKRVFWRGNQGAVATNTG